MSDNISYSAWKKYHQCPKLYDLHYNTKLRPTGKSSALYFGSAIDEALNEMLLGNKDFLKVFRDHFKYEDLRDAVWDVRDFVPELFTPDQSKKLEGADYDYLCWASMRIKGRMLLEEYHLTIFPNIKKVHSVQKNLTTRKGILDAVIDYGDYGKVLIDHKTSAMYYKREAIESDTQLALYATDQDIKKVGYIVLSKDIKLNKKKKCIKCGHDGTGRQHTSCNNIIKGKRCHGKWDIKVNPKASIQVIIDDCPEINKELIVDSIEQTEKLIESKVFPRNLNACGKMYGKPCPYINFCWKKDESGLEYKKENK